MFQFRDGVNKAPGYDKPGNTCDTCYGWGLWAMGDPAPMGPMDAEEGMPTLECPECGENPNPLPVFNLPEYRESSIVLPGTLEAAFEKIAELRHEVEELKKKLEEKRG